VISIKTKSQRGFIDINDEFVEGKGDKWKESLGCDSYGPLTY